LFHFWTKGKKAAEVCSVRGAAFCLVQNLAGTSQRKTYPYITPDTNLALLCLDIRVGSAFCLAWVRCFSTAVTGTLCRDGSPAAALIDPALGPFLCGLRKGRSRWQTNVTASASRILDSEVFTRGSVEVTLTEHQVLLISHFADIDLEPWIGHRKLQGGEVK
jgi:hypothetical protein